jgi:hypothetical protein
VSAWILVRRFADGIVKIREGQESLSQGFAGRETLDEAGFDESSRMMRTGQRELQVMRPRNKTRHCITLDVRFVLSCDRSSGKEGTMS